MTEFEETLQWQRDFSKQYYKMIQDMEDRHNEFVKKYIEMRYE